MTRAVVQGVILFLLPFVLFGLYLVIRRRNPLLWSHWSDKSLWLTIAGLSFVVMAVMVVGRGPAPLPGDPSRVVADRRQARPRRSASSAPPTPGFTPKRGAARAPTTSTRATSAL